MKLGFMTACLPDAKLDDLVVWASANGYTSLEVSAWPGITRNHIDVLALDEQAIERTHELFRSNGVEISALSYYENMLHADLDRRQAQRTHLLRVVDAAAALGVAYVGVLVGRDITLPVADNLALAETIWPELVEYAGERGVRFVVENSPMLGSHPDTYPMNLAYSPELWEWMFGLGLNLNYDPSHLLWLGADPIEAVRPYLDRVLHVQAKDVEIDPVAKTRYGHFGQIIGRSSTWDSGWWRYRIPGRGHVDFVSVIDLLDGAGFTGSVAVEHEDATWSGTDDLVKKGLVVAQRTLGPLIDGLAR